MWLFRLNVVWFEVITCTQSTENSAGMGNNLLKFIVITLYYSNITLILVSWGGGDQSEYLFVVVPRNVYRSARLNSLGTQCVQHTKTSQP